MLILINKISDDFEHTWLADIFSIQVDEVVVVADVPIKLRRNALPSEHIDHFVLVFVSQFFAHGKEIQVFNEQRVHVQYKALIVKVISINSSVRNARQKISRFDSCG